MQRKIMAYLSPVSIANANKIEEIHNKWCSKNGYPVKWRTKVGRPKDKLKDDVRQRLHRLR